MTTSISLYPPTRGTQPAVSNLPPILQTPSGLAILELQGTINLPQDADGDTAKDVDLGRIEFPDYAPDAIGSAWMKRVYMYIGQHQRLIGQVVKLPRAMAVVRRRDSKATEGSGGVSHEQGGESLEVVEIVTHKLMFSGRPEPVGTAHAPPA